MSKDLSEPLAALGGPPTFPGGLAFCRPVRPPLDWVFRRMEASYDRGMLTSGRLVAELEDAIAERFGVEHVVAVSSCTSGLMLAVQALVDGRPGPVVEPSFTFSASAHCAAWSGRKLRFVEVDPQTFQVDLDALAAVVSGASLVIATHIFGAPCAPAEVEAVAGAVGVPVLFDAAHAFGASSGGRPVGGFGNAEVFSLSPTKVLVAGEGGLVATNDRELAKRLRIGRDYGNPGNYDTQFVGLNARLSEFHAAMALESLDLFEATSRRRRDLARRYREGLDAITGVHCQRIPDDDTSAYKDFTISIDPELFGLDRDQLVHVLAAEGVETRNYFDPPVHRQTAYRAGRPGALPVTDRLSSAVLSLPIYPDLVDDAVDQIIEMISAAHGRADAVAAELAASGRLGPLRPWRIKGERRATRHSKSAGSAR